MSPHAITVTLDVASGLVVTVPYQTTAGGTATAGDDYTAISCHRPDLRGRCDPDDLQCDH